MDPHHFAMEIDAISAEAKPFLIPVVGITVGAVLLAFERTLTVGKLVLYFGAQSFMNIYMGWVMRMSVTVPKGTRIESTGEILAEDLMGCPAGFALTALQQIVSLLIFAVFWGVSYFTPWRYSPKRLSSLFEVFCVLVFGCVFALNIALNNFSLVYINIGVNLVIRSCLPLTTFVYQQGLALCSLYPFRPCRAKEVGLMVVGVLCAGVFTVAKILGSAQRSDSRNVILGVLLCIASLPCGSLNLALAGVLGEAKLNVYDTVAYMAIPATLLLAPIAFFLEKPVPGEWSRALGAPRLTDFQILVAVWQLNKRTVAWLCISGALSFIYNIIQVSIVHSLSPSATAFGGNFNKAALVFLTLLVPFLRVHQLPPSPYIEVIWVAVIVNIAAFGYYTHLMMEAAEEGKDQEKYGELRDAAASGEDASTASADEEAPSEAGSSRSRSSSESGREEDKSARGC